MFDVVGVGDIDIDVYVTVDKIPGHDEKVKASAHQYHPGGMVANFLVALSRLGTRCVFHGPLGDDFYGKMALDDLKANNVGIEGAVCKENGETYFCIVMLDSTGEKSLIVVPTDCISPSKEDLSEQVISSARHMHTVYFDDVESAVDIAKAKGLSVSIDIEPTALSGDNSHLKSLLKKVNVLFMNNMTASALVGTDDITKCTDSLKTLGPDIVCITMGAQGGMVLSKEESEPTHFSAYKVPVVDTTGAGDCFAAGFIHGYLNKWHVDKCARFGSAVSALKITSAGGHSGAPQYVEVTKFIEEKSNK